jgi:type I restriction enzyme S subunit
MIGDLKPYPAYRDSGVAWLGEVPAHWKVMPGRACYFERKGSNIGLKETTVLSLSYGSIIIKPKDKLHGLVPESFETYQIVEPGDIICRPTDLQNDWNSLRFGHSDHRGIITSAYLCFRTQRFLNRRYGHFLLHTYDLKKVFYGLGSGLRQNLDWRDFKYLPCVVPTNPEQTAIVRFLDHADHRIRRAISGKRRLIALLTEEKQAIIHRAVTRGLDPDVPLKASGNRWFPNIPENWDLLPMRRVISRAVDGPHHSPEYLDEGVPFLSARNIKTDRWSLGDVKYISESDYQEFSKRVKPEIGDVLFTKGGTTGVARPVDLPFRFQVWVHVAVLKLNKEKIVPEYLAMALNSPRCYEQSQLFTRGATNQDLGLGRMKDIVFPVPSVFEQKAIIEFTTKTTSYLDTAMATTRREISLLLEFRTRLIADVVTGKLDVREAAAVLPDEADEPAPLDAFDPLADGEASPELDADGMDGIEA